MSCSRTVDKLKTLAVKLGCAANTAAVTGNTIDEVINFINTHYPLPKVPATAGNYKLAVDSAGVATWVEIT